MCGRPLRSKTNLQERCGTWSGADMCAAFDAAHTPRAQMGVRGSGPIQAHALEALVAKLVDRTLILHLPPVVDRRRDAGGLELLPGSAIERSRLHARHVVAHRALGHTDSGRCTRAEDSWVVEEQIGWCAMSRGGEAWRGLLVI